MISFNGFNEGVLTFADYGSALGAPVAVTNDSKTNTATNGSDFIGVCVNKIGDGYITAQISGYVELPYTGTAPTAGYACLIANGDGGVKTGTDIKKSYKVLKVDTENKIVGFIL